MQKSDITFDEDDRYLHRCWDEGKRLRSERRKSGWAAPGLFSGLEEFKMVDVSDVGMGVRIDDEGRASSCFDEDWWE